MEPGSASEPGSALAPVTTGPALPPGPGSAPGPGPRTGLAAAAPGLARPGPAPRAPAGRDQGTGQLRRDRRRGLRSCARTAGPRPAPAPPPAPSGWRPGPVGVCAAVSNCGTSTAPAGGWASGLLADAAPPAATGTGTGTSTGLAGSASADRGLRPALGLRDQHDRRPGPARPARVLAGSASASASWRTAAPGPRVRVRAVRGPRVWASGCACWRPARRTGPAAGAGSPSPAVSWPTAPGTTGTGGTGGTGTGGTGGGQHGCNWVCQHRHHVHHSTTGHLVGTGTATTTAAAPAARAGSTGTGSTGTGSTGPAHGYWLHGHRPRGYQPRGHRGQRDGWNHDSPRITPKCGNTPARWPHFPPAACP